MLLAYSEDGTAIHPFKGGRALCPGCNTIVIAKCGDTNTWHWSHDSLEDCDGWKYEPKSKWHLDWQRHFHEDDTEVIIRKGDKFHIADIVGTNDVVIEVQHSHLSAQDIEARERFYEKMIWILNVQNPAQTLKFENLQVDFQRDVLNIYFNKNREVNPWRIEVTLPSGDDGSIRSIIENKPELYRPSPEKENVYFILDKSLVSGSWYIELSSVPRDLKSAFMAHTLHEGITLKFSESRKSCPVLFQWKSMRRSFLNSSMPIFIDLSPTYLLLVKSQLHKFLMEGKIITKKRFLQKYRHKMPDES